MSWEVVVFGSLVIPEPRVEEWLTSTVSPADFPWLAEFGFEARSDTPEALLSRFAEMSQAPHELFEVTADGGRVTVRCFASDEVYQETCLPLALLFASGASHGGAGHMTVFGYRGLRFGVRTTVASGLTSLEVLRGPDLAAVERSSDFRALDEMIHARFDALVGRAPTPQDPRQAAWSVNPFTGRRVRVSAELR